MNEHFKAYFKDDAVVACVVTMASNKAGVTKTIINRNLKNGHFSKKLSYVMGEITGVSPLFFQEPEIFTLKGVVKNGGKKC